jgi:hypothetical protein
LGIFLLLQKEKKTGGNLKIKKIKEMESGVLKF